MDAPAIILAAALLLLAEALLLFLLRPAPRVRLHLSSISFNNKPRKIMTTNLRSPVSQFAQIQLVPVNEFGTKVKLDEDAIVAEVVSGEGASASVQVLNDDNGDRRFLVNLVPGDAPGEYQFKIRGDAEPGEGVTILEEEFIYTAVPSNAVSLGATVQYLPKTSLPQS